MMSIDNYENIKKLLLLSNKKINKIHNQQGINDSY